MKLSKCTHGTIVQRKAPAPYSEEREIGMIVGITNNTYDEAPYKYEPDRAIPLVQWSSGETTPINHDNIEPYED